jgi:hypothetical protein
MIKIIIESSFSRNASAGTNRQSGKYPAADSKLADGRIGGN